LCRLPASGARPNSNRRQSESARNGRVRVGQALPDGVIKKIFNLKKHERNELWLTTQGSLYFKAEVARDRFRLLRWFLLPGVDRLRQAEPDLHVWNTPAARVWHERRVAIIGAREDSGLTFSSDLTGKSAASPNSV
jgi:hypothetical protein